MANLSSSPCLGIGVTGHRLDRLGTDTVEGLASALDVLFATIETAAHPLSPDRLRLITGLAEGADGIAADRASQRGWELDVILPFFRDDYARDFDQGSAQEMFRHRLSTCSAILELPGERDADGGHGVAYERAGRLVLAQCDLLVAVWDGGPTRGRGGAAQIIAEAVLLGIPVIHFSPDAAHPPLLLWDGLEERDLGQQTLDTVARGDLAALPALIRTLVQPPSDPDSRASIDRFEQGRDRRWSIGFAYPLLLGVMGIKRPRWKDLTGRAADNVAIHALCASDTSFARRLRDTLAPRFARADAVATRVALLFRSVYVTNFVFAALAVILSLLGLALPAGAKPVLIALELATIGTILIQTRRGTRAAWHRHWLDHRALAERLRCLTLATQLGDLDLRAADGRTAAWVGWYARATARAIGLPSARIDEPYLRCVRDSLIALIDDQVAYLQGDARRMHRLEHRLHRLGTIMFALTALACVGLLVFKAMDAVLPAMAPFAHPIAIAATIIGAALPAIGAAIYGIRMQGDFAGIAERNHVLAAHLSTLRGVMADDALGFDTLSRRARRVTGLLTEDLSSWLRTYHARPLALPG